MEPAQTNPKPKKEPAAAFMPSSNDSLCATTNGDNHGHHDSSNGPAYPFESAILSPGTSQQSQSYFEIGPPKEATHRQAQTLPERQSVGSASQLPPAQNMPSRTSDSVWFDLYYRLVDSHATERAIWQAERDQLLAERQKLLDHIGILPKASPSANVSTSKENDKIFYNAATVKHANESLRKFSQSSRSDRGSIDDEETPPQRRVSIAANAKTITSPPLHPIPENETDTPRTPAGALSPVPLNFVMDAGATPMKKRSPPALDEPSVADVAPLRNGLDMENGLDGDRELRSPKMLPSLPSNDNLDPLDTLNQKLQAVLENPDANQPEAVAAAQRLEDSEAVSDSISPKHLPKDISFYNGMSRPMGPPDAIHDADVGVKLKKKRSTNFGAPFGKLS